MNARAALLLTLPTAVAPAQACPAQSMQEAEAPYRALTFDGKSMELPIELARSLVLVDGVRVNGEGPFRFMLDTGAQGAGRIDVSLAERLGLTPAGEVMGGDGTDRPGRAMDVYELESLSIGGLRAEGVRVLSRDYNEHGAAARGPVDGILGIDLFSTVLLTLDYPASTLRIEAGALDEPDGNEILALVPDAAIPTITLSIAGVEHRAHLDSGAMASLSLPGNLEESLPLVGDAQVVGQARTVSGTFDIRMAPLDAELAIGRHVTYRPTAVFGAPLRDVIVGGEVLSEYALTLDLAHDRVRFWRGGFAAHESAPARTSLRQDELRVPLEYVYGRPVIEATIAGHGPYRFVLDTGAGANVLNADLAHELELAVTGETSLGVPGGEQRVAAETHSIAEITVGAATFSDVPAMSWELPEIMNALGDVRGILGIHLFHDLLLTIDTPAGELALEHGSLPADATAYLLDGDGLPEFDIEVGGRAVPAHLDTGNPSMLVVPLALAPELPLAHEPLVVGRGRTASGDFEIRGAPLNGTARIAGLVLEDPTLTFHEWNEYANIGGGVLAGRALAFDQRQRRLSIGERVEPNATAESEAGGPVRRIVRSDSSAKRGTYGVMLAMTNRGPIPLNGVVPGSVAEKAGLQAGDSIVALNGVEVDELDMNQRGAAFRAPKLELTVERDGKRIDFEIAHATDG